jgi:hypothetical protein
VIPVFQRDYSWTETQCQQLWLDILQTARDESSKGHFLGSVVYVSTGDTRAGFTPQLFGSSHTARPCKSWARLMLPDRVGWCPNG